MLSPPRKVSLPNLVLLASSRSNVMGTTETRSAVGPERGVLGFATSLGAVKCRTAMHKNPAASAAVIPRLFNAT